MGELFSHLSSACRAQSAISMACFLSLSSVLLLLASYFAALQVWGLIEGGDSCGAFQLPNPRSRAVQSLETWSLRSTSWRLNLSWGWSHCSAPGWSFETLWQALHFPWISLVCPSSSSFAGRFLLDSSFWPFSLATNTPRGALNGSENHVPKIPRWENLQKCRLYNFLNLVMLATILTHLQSISICHYLPMSVYLNGWTTSPGREIPFFSIWLLPWHWLPWSLPGFWTAAAILADWSHLRYILLLIGYQSELYYLANILTLPIKSHQPSSRMGWYGMAHLKGPGGWRTQCRANAAWKTCWIVSLWPVDVWNPVDVRNEVCGFHCRIDSGGYKPAVCCPSCMRHGEWIVEKTMDIVFRWIIW